MPSTALDGVRLLARAAHGLLLHSRRHRADARNPGRHADDPTGLAVDGTRIPLHRRRRHQHHRARRAGSDLRHHLHARAASACRSTIPAAWRSTCSHNLYIADAGNNRIVKPRAGQRPGRARRRLRPHAFQSRGVAVSPSGTLTVADAGNTRFVSISSAGAGTAMILGGVAVAQPAGATITDTGDLLLTDLTAGLITVHRNAGQLHATPPPRRWARWMPPTATSRSPSPTAAIRPAVRHSEWRHQSQPERRCPSTSAPRAPPAPLSARAPRPPQPISSRVDATCTYLLSFTPLNTGPEPLHGDHRRRRHWRRPATNLTLHLNGTGFSQDRSLPRQRRACDHHRRDAGQHHRHCYRQRPARSTPATSATSSLPPPIRRPTSCSAAGYTFHAGGAGTHVFRHRLRAWPSASWYLLRQRRGRQLYRHQQPRPGDSAGRRLDIHGHTRTPCSPAAAVTLSVSFASGQHHAHLGHAHRHRAIPERHDGVGSAALNNGGQPCGPRFRRRAPRRFPRCTPATPSFSARRRRPPRSVVDFTLAVAAGAPSTGTITGRAARPATSWCSRPWERPPCPRESPSPLPGSPARTTTS